MINTEFRTIKRIPRYEINQEGKVWDTVNERYVTTSYKDFGATVTLSIGKNRTTTIRLATLLYETFIGRIPENFKVDYADGNIYNRSLDNLILVPKRKWSNYDKMYKVAVRCIETDDIYESAQKCANELNVTLKSIVMCCEHSESVSLNNGLHFEFIVD